jgi:TRAP-type transport system periplasmic protein
MMEGGIKSLSVAEPASTVDGLEISLTVMASNSYDEVTRYLSTTGHAYNALALLVSQRFMDNLSDEEQEVVR